MRLTLFYSVLICAGLMAAPPRLSARGSGTNALGPRMTFVTNQYHFGRIMAGTLVKYSFIVSNAGDEPLIISKVVPGCHCTTAGDWSGAHQIEPGRTGEIPIQFDSATFDGPLTRSIRVTSNDRVSPVRALTLEGTLWKPFVIDPPVAYITVMPDAASNATGTIHISSECEEAVTLTDFACTSASFKAQLKTIKPGKEFELTVTVVPPLAAGNTEGTISFHTSVTNIPVLSIPAIAMMQPDVGLMPLQIFLPRQVNAWVTNVITFSNNGTNPLALSDAESSDKRILLELKETVPGKIFQLAAAFPPRYEIAPGMATELSVKSNRQRSPVVVVPVKQFPRAPAAIKLP